MQIHITPHHLPLTPSLRQFALERILALGEHVAEVLSAHVVLLHEPAHTPGGRFSARVRLAVRGPDVHAHDTSADLYAAIERVVSKLARRLRKRKTRQQRHLATARRHRPTLRTWPRSFRP